MGLPVKGQPTNLKNIKCKLSQGQQQQHYRACILYTHMMIKVVYPNVMWYIPTESKMNWTVSSAICMLQWIYFKNNYRNQIDSCKCFRIINCNRIIMIILGWYPILNFMFNSIESYNVWIWNTYVGSNRNVNELSFGCPHLTLIFKTAFCHLCTNFFC